jgi:hypothetical protein
VAGEDDVHAGAQTLQPRQVGDPPPGDLPRRAGVAGLHSAVLSRPDLLGEPFVKEVSALVIRYLAGGRSSRRARR